MFYLPKILVLGRTSGQFDSDEPLKYKRLLTICKLLPCFVSLLFPSQTLIFQTPPAAVHVPLRSFRLPTAVTCSRCTFPFPKPWHTCAIKCPSIPSAAVPSASSMLLPHLATPAPWDRARFVPKHSCSEVGLWDQLLSILPILWQINLLINLIAFSPRRAAGTRMRHRPGGSVPPAAPHSSPLGTRPWPSLWWGIHRVSQ